MASPAIVLLMLIHALYSTHSFHGQEIVRHVCVFAIFVLAPLYHILMWASSFMMDQCLYFVSLLIRVIKYSNPPKRVLLDLNINNLLSYYFLITHYIGKYTNGML